MFGIGEKILEMIGSIFKWIYDVTIGPFIDIPSLQDLVFGRREGESLVFNTFTQEEISGAYVPGVSMFYAIAAGIVLFSIVIGGMRISGSGINPGNRNYFFDFVKDIAIVTIVLFNLPNFYQFIFWINDYIISTVQDGFSNTSIGSLDDLKTALDDEENFIGELIINLTLVVLGLWAFFYYTMRKLTIMIFMILGPVMVALYLIPQTKEITLGWIREFIGTVLVQAVHAITFFLIAVLSITADGTIESVMLYVIFIPVGEAVKGIFGLTNNTQGALGKATTFSGLAALGGVIGATKGAISGKSVSGALQSMKNGAQTGAKTGKSDDGSNQTMNVGSNKPSAPGRVSEKMLRAGDIVSGGGKAVVGSLGAIAGAALGPAGALMGAELGSRGGGALGGITARSTAAIGQGINSRIQKGIGAHSLSHSEGDSQLTSISKGLGAATGVSGISRQFRRAGSSALQEMRNNPSRPIRGALSGLNEELNISDKLKQAGNAIVHPKESFDNYRSANPIAKQRNYEKVSGYVGGVIGGRTGHQVGNQLAQKVSPFKDKVQNQIYSPSQIMQNARRDTNGNIAPGSVQLVTTSEDSYIQIENQSGQTQIVSKMVGGNANLKKGQSTSVDISKQLQHIVANPNINQNVENMLKKEVQQHQVVNQRNLQRALNDARRNPQGFKGTDLR